MTGYTPPLAVLVLALILLGRVCALAARHLTDEEKRTGHPVPDAQRNRVLDDRMTPGDARAGVTGLLLLLTALAWLSLTGAAHLAAR